MWVFTNRGFFSVVEYADDPTMLVVRARAKRDLDALRSMIPGLKIVVLKNRDYEYRAFVTREAWETAILALTRDIDYGNFKDSVKAKMGPGRAGIYTRIWSVALDIARPQRVARRLFDDDAYEARLPWEEPVEATAPTYVRCPHGQPLNKAWERIVNRSENCMECDGLPPDTQKRGKRARARARRQRN